MTKIREDLPSSPLTFSDGANYRIEVSGIETAEILEAVVDEAKIQGIPIHRAIATVAGSKFYSDRELKKLAKVAAEYKVEVIICPGDLAHGFFGNPNRNLNWQNNNEINAYRDEILRCAKLGFRGFLTWSFPMLMMLGLLREHGLLPSETIFKLSTFANSCNVLDFLLAKHLGANTVNTANGLTLENLSDIRKTGPNIVMDVHITFWQNLLKANTSGRLELCTEFYDRVQDAPEIARICSPVYFKFEAGTPGIGVYDVPRPDWTFKDLAEHKRKDVRVAAQIVRRIKEEYSELNLSDWGPDDLRVPKI
ncbi:MAG: hypothetical protein Q8L57_02380 [bacterium]|nr:hypothetical protein [bacterium]